MFSWLKKHFIPHEGNEHRPHILRDDSTRNIVAIILLLEIFTFFVPILAHINTSGNMATVLPAVLDDLTNQERQIQKLPVLSINPLLNKAAEMKAQDMATKGYFAHTSPDGKTPWYWLEQVGYSYQYAGENLAINFSDSKDVTLAWMESPTHKANIVKGNYTEIGTGVASGLYNGQQTIFVAQVYANPLPKIFKQTILDKNVNAKVKNTVNIINTEKNNVLGAETVSDAKINPAMIEVTTALQPTLWQKLLSSPRNAIDKFLFVIFVIILATLLLYLFIKNKNYHKDLITNGFIVLAVIGVIFLMNYYWSHKDMVITDSFNYSIDNK